MPFRFVDQSGDLALEIEATSRVGLFVEAAAAFTASLLGPARVEAVVARRIVLAAPTLDLLLRDFLDELLWLFESEAFLPAELVAEVSEEAHELRLLAEVRGEPRDPERHPLRLLLKGVTYHRLAAGERTEGWRARVVLDL